MFVFISSNLRLLFFSSLIFVVRFSDSILSELDVENQNLLEKKIVEVLENERVIRDERNEIKALAQNTGIGVDSFTKDKIKEINDRIINLKDGQIN